MRQRLLFDLFIFYGVVRLTQHCRLVLFGNAACLKHLLIDRITEPEHYWNWTGALLLSSGSYYHVVSGNQVLHYRYGKAGSCSEHLPPALVLGSSHVIFFVKPKWVTTWPKMNPPFLLKLGTRSLTQAILQCRGGKLAAALTPHVILSLYLLLH